VFANLALIAKTDWSEQARNALKRMQAEEAAAAAHAAQVARAQAARDGGSEPELSTSTVSSEKKRRSPRVCNARSDGGSEPELELESGSAMSVASSTASARSSLSGGDESAGLRSGASLGDDDSDRFEIGGGVDEELENELRTSGNGNGNPHASSGHERPGVALLPSAPDPSED
jgi:hypothetical protein